MKKVRIATRKSPLALWQAAEVARSIELHHSQVTTELVKLITEGDKKLDAPLASFGGKGLFLKELEQSLSDRQADIAVHSMKDVPAQLPEGLDIFSVLKRSDPGDALVSRDYSCLDELPRGAVIGTSSARRKSNLLRYRPDLEIRNLRGNLATRLVKLDRGDYHAIVLATAGLERLDKAHRIRQRIDHSILLPAIGQGIIGIEVASDNLSAISIMSAINHMPSWFCLLAERSCGARLEADCHMPLSVHASFMLDGQLRVQAMVCNLSGDDYLYADTYGTFDRACELGHNLAETLLSQGADRLLGL